MVASQRNAPDSSSRPVVATTMLADRAPEVWIDARDRMVALVRRRLLSRGPGRDEAEQLALDLAAVAVSPREVIDLYGHAVDTITDELDADEPIGAVVTTARMVALEIMGWVAGSYRAQIWPERSA